MSGALIPLTPALEVAMAVAGLLGASGWICALALWSDAKRGRAARLASRRYRQRRRAGMPTARPARPAPTEDKFALLRDCAGQPSWDCPRCFQDTHDPARPRSVCRGPAPGKVLP